MIADGILATHNGTGGTGALTLVSVTGYPDFNNAFTGNRWIYYAINEYTDSSKVVLKQRESGVGTFAAGTGVLTRSVIQSTWDGTNYRPQYGTATAPSAINFGATAANIDIICAPSAANSILPINAYVSGNAGTDSVGLSGLGIQTSATYALTAGTIYYSPIWIAHLGPFSSASVRLTTATTGTPGGLYVGLYEIAGDTGLPAKQLVGFGSLGSTSSTAPGTLSSTPISTPVFLTPGWYYQAVLWVAGSATGTPNVQALQPLTGPAGVSFVNGGSVASLTLASQTALTDPAVAPTAPSSVVGTIPLVTFK